MVHLPLRNGGFSPSFQEYADPMSLHSLPRERMDGEPSTRSAKRGVKWLNEQLGFNTRRNHPLAFLCREDSARFPFLSPPPSASEKHHT